MCLLALAWKQMDHWPLLLAANRDEFYQRPTAALLRWPEGFYAGRDLQAGGSWLAAAEDGRFAAITNYRERSAPPARPRSRGDLVVEFLRGGQLPATFAAGAAQRNGDYAPFNLLLGDLQSLWYVASRAGAPRELGPGVHLLSNHLLDTPWPKVRRLRDRFEAALGHPDPFPNLFDALADRTLAPDAELPSTGLPLDWERALSAAFVVAPGYGTRCATVLALAPGRGRMLERSFDPHGQALETREVHW